MPPSNASDPKRRREQKRRAWTEQTQLPAHLCGQRRSTVRHTNRLRAQRMGKGKHRGRVSAG